MYTVYRLLGRPFSAGEPTHAYLWSTFTKKRYNATQPSYKLLIYVSHQSTKKTRSHRSSYRMDSALWKAPVVHSHQNGISEGENKQRDKPFGPTISDVIIIHLFTVNRNSSMERSATIFKSHSFGSVLLI